jgi:uncharacterized coiled-coil DUF342 family protein
LDKKLDEIERQIDKIHDHKHKFIEDMRKTMSGLRDKSDAVPIRELLRAKVTQKKEIREQFNKIKDEHDDKKDELNNLFEQSQKLRNKMKNLEKAEDIITQLKYLKNRQQNDQLTPNEEKIICKQIADLEKSLPYAEPLEKLDREAELVRQAKGKIGKTMNELYKKLQEIEEEIQEYKNDLEGMDKTKEESQKNLDPTI